MKLDEIKVTMPVIVMSKAEHNELWHSSLENRKICGKHLVHWITDDGNNEMLLEGETTYRKIILVG